MERITEEEKILVETLEVFEEDFLFIEETLVEVDKVKKSLSTQKELLYFSGNIIIFKFIYKDNIIQDNGVKIEGDEYTIFQVYDRETEKSSYHYINDVKIEKSLLLNLINKGDSVGVKKGYI